MEGYYRIDLLYSHIQTLVTKSNSDRTQDTDKISIQMAKLLFTMAHVERMICLDDRIRDNDDKVIVDSILHSWSYSCVIVL